MTLFRKIALAAGCLGLTALLPAQLVPGLGSGLAVDANTVALFRFEDAAATALDAAGAHRDATVTNTASVAGLFGSGRAFNGVGDRLEFGAAFNALSGATGWTIEFFAKSYDGVYAPFLVNHNPSAGWYVYPRSGDILYWIKTSATGNTWTTQATAAGVALDTAWHYYAMTWSPGTISMYRDGVLVGSASASGSWGGGNSYGVWLDFDSYDNSYGGAGVVDEMRFSSIARSSTEIANVYAAAAIPETAVFPAFAGVTALTWAWRRRRTGLAGGSSARQAPTRNRSALPKAHESRKTRWNHCRRRLYRSMITRSEGDSSWRCSFQPV